MLTHMELVPPKTNDQANMLTVLERAVFDSAYENYCNASEKPTFFTSASRLLQQALQHLLAQSVVTCVQCWSVEAASINVRKRPSETHVLNARSHAADVNLRAFINDTVSEDEIKHSKNCNTIGSRRCGRKNFENNHAARD
jgi:hypothetical protein